MTLPVVFLPGIMGSRLRWRDGSARVWDPDDSKEMLSWVLLGSVGGEKLARALHHLVPVEVMEYSGRGLSARQVAQGWGGVAAEYYHALLNDLEAAGYSATSLGYDWRDDILALGRTILDRLQARRIVGDFVLVTHSMGGLVARAAMAQDPELAKRIRGVVHICQPCHGAPVLYRRMFTGCVTEMDGTNWIDYFFCKILGTSGPQFVTNVCGLPGALQLLPTYDYQYPEKAHLSGWTGSAPRFVEDLYGHTSAPPGLCPRNAGEYLKGNLRRNLSATQTFQTTIQGIFHPNTWFLYGTGLLTDIAVFSKGQTVAPVRLPAGDGTVPEPSSAPGRSESVPLEDLAANPQRLRYGYQPELDHAKACNHETVRKAVVAIVGSLM